ncbi:MAG TPA: EthD family reductase [Anaerolineae bacterium]|nr:EthD family reductase [Anaerolineae bacterium]
MYKMVVLYTRPEDPEAFDAAYAEHLKLVEKVPGSAGYTVTKFNKTLAGQELYLMFEMRFASKEDMKTGMNSPEMAAVGKDSRRFSANLHSILLGAEE